MNKNKRIISEKEYKQAKRDRERLLKIKKVWDKKFEIEKPLNRIISQIK